MMVDLLDNDTVVLLVLKTAGMLAVLTAFSQAVY